MSLISTIAAMGGGSSDVISIDDFALTDFGFGTPADVQIQLNSSGGFQYFRNNTSDGFFSPWIDPISSAPGSYQVRATLNSGSIATGTTGTWLPLSTTRSWSVAVSASAGTQSANLTLEIRDGTGPTLATRTATIEAQSV